MKVKASELIELIKSKMDNDDPEIEFQSYEWRDDLEFEEYLGRYFDEIKRKNKKIIIRISR